MEEYIWLVFISIAIILRGLSSFTLKLASYKDLSSIHFFIVTHIVGTLCILFLVDYPTLFSTDILYYGLISGVLVYINSKLSFEVLKHLSASFVFVNSRIITTIGILIVGFIFFQDQLTLFQLFGVIFGILVFVLLYDKTEKINSKANFKLGIQLFMLFALILIIINTINKIGSSISIFNLLFYFMIIPLFLFLIEAFIKKIHLLNLIQFSSPKTKQLILFGFLNGMFGLTNMVFYLKALTLKEFIIVYKMYSFEIFIPIILSYLFLDEELNKRKILALILTTLSIIFLI